MKQKTIIYPVFLPHAGCPFTCLYCNQRAVVRPVAELDVLEQFHRQLEPIVEQARQAPSAGELAFFGGTFTALPAQTMLHVLDTVASYVQAGLFSGIRFSTRPDSVTPEVCAVLSPYPVRTVELGAQSLSDDVLAAARRGYDHREVVRAAGLVRRHGWVLGIQLMVGLPGDSVILFQRSVSRTIELNPDFVRIYPTLVLKGTQLAAMYHEGLYEPLVLEDAVSLCASAYGSFVQASIPVARMGLHADRELEQPGNIVAGPYHPAFGYLVRVRWWRNRVDRWLKDLDCAGRAVTIRAPAHSISELIGPGRSNLAYWRKRWGLEDVWVEGDPHCERDRFECELSRKMQSS